MRRRTIIWESPPSRTGARPRPPRSGARCWRRLRPTRRGGRWCCRHWRASAGRPAAPRRPLVLSAWARIGGAPSAPALSEDTMTAARDMSESDRGAMIRGMVDRLATRLKQNGDDVEGWLRLVRAYMVMGERDKAVSALSDARQAVANDAERLRQLNEGLKNLGLDG